MLNRLRIGAKLMVGFGVVVVLSVFLGGMAIYFMRSVGDEATHLAEDSAPTVKYANEVERNTMLVTMDSRAFQFTGDQAFYERSLKGMEKLQAAMKETNRLADDHKLESLDKNIHQCIDAVDDFTREMKQVYSLDAELKKIYQSMSDAAGRFVKNSEAFVESQNTLIQTNLAERQRKQQLVSEIAQFGVNARVTNFKAQATSDMALMQKAIDGLDGLKAVVEQLRAITRKQEDLKQIDTIVASAAEYQQAMRAYREAALAKNEAGERAARAEMDKAAGLFVGASNTFETSQRQQTIDEVKERTHKLELANNVVNIGYQMRVANLAAQALRKPEDLKVGIDMFAKADKQLDELKAITVNPANLTQIESVREALASYRDAMQAYMNAWVDLNSTGDKAKQNRG